jgi:hypothetical protein
VAASLARMVTNRTQRIQDDNPGVLSREQSATGEMMVEPIVASVVRQPQTVSGDIPSAVSPVTPSRARRA